MDDEATQATQTQRLTQDVFDPRRGGRNNSGLNEPDISDVLCILHPSSPAAFRVVAVTARLNPQHVLQNHGLTFLGDGDETELETILQQSIDTKQAQDLALRFSSRVCDPAMGFCFGRSLMLCDVNLDADAQQKRISQRHFRIYVNPSGILMLEDMSTNGTVVDGHTLGGKKYPDRPKTRMLKSGAIIEILSPTQAEDIKFILRIPSRDQYFEEYLAKFRDYMAHVAVAEQKRRAIAMQQGPPIPDAAARGMLAAPLAGPPNSKVIPTFNPPMQDSNHGMYWSGDPDYNCVGLLGKGAFATVYQIATKMNGDLYAAKELEKKRFMKNGIIDFRLDNEMRIMKELRHPNIVQYIDYVEMPHHLYIIMEYVPCGDLQGYMVSHGTLPEDPARDMTRQVLNALAYLHQKNITHRDIKPDNILICSEDPFTVKLTDFGLSKVVKNNETFLKTFCGTLLYCAPEVFPHYDTYAPSRRQKRRRQTPLQQTNHRYSQLVDIWSYAAVLWFVLCGKPPFEGIVDANGRGMFDKIMETPLDVRPLREHGISEEAVDLLLEMLNTDPTVRPSELECLAHAWLNSGNALPDPRDENGLTSIPEQDEELDASNLSIHDAFEASGSNHGQDSPDSEKSNHFHKRRKGESFSTPREQAQIPSSFEEALQSLPVITNAQSNHFLPPVLPKSQRLFGEIGQSALKSSGALDSYTYSAFSTVGYPSDEARYRTLKTQSNGSSMDGDALPGQSEESFIAAAQGHYYFQEEAGAASSLFGAESMVRALKMASPEPGNSAVHTPTKPSSPRTPNQSRPSTGNAGNQQQRTPSLERTPKPRVFSRQINLPLPTSLSYNPQDQQTKTLDHTHQPSPGESLQDAASPHLGMISLPQTEIGSYESSAGTNLSFNKENEHGVLDQTVSPSPIPDAVNFKSPNDDFLKPAARLGKLTSTEDSFISVSLPLTQRITTWGRNPNNTISYPHGNDTRVPKCALEVWFHARGIEEYEKAGKDWMKLEGLHAIVRTQSRHGIFVNGVFMKEKDHKGRMCWGKLYSGDEIIVSHLKEGTSLRFVCEFFHGLSAASRAPGEKFMVQAS